MICNENFIYFFIYFVNKFKIFKNVSFENKLIGFFQLFFEKDVLCFCSIDSDTQKKVRRVLSKIGDFSSAILRNAYQS